MRLSLQLVLTTASKATHQIGIFALSIIFARYFSKEDYGNYLQVQLIINICVWAFVLGIPHSVYYFLPKIMAKKKYIIRTMAVLMMLSTLVSALLFLSNNLLSELLSNGNLINLAIIISILVLFQIPLTIVEPILISANRVTTFVKFDFGFNILFFTAILTPVLMHQGIAEIFRNLMLFYFTQLVVMYTVLGFVARSYKADKTLTQKDPGLMQQLKYAFPIGVSQSLFEVGQYADKVIVSSAFNPAVYAEYTRGAMEIPFVHMIGYTLDNLLMRQFTHMVSEKRQDDMLQKWHLVIKMTSLYLYPITVFLIFIGPLLIPALFSEKYLMSAVIFQIYTISHLFRVTTYIVILRAVGDTAILAWLALISVVFNIVVTLLLIRWIGIIGAPIATVLTVALLSVIYLHVIRGIFKVSWRRVFPWSGLLRVFLHSVVSLIPVLLVMQLAIDSWLKIGLASIVYLGACLLQLKRFAVVSSGERAQIRAIISRRLHWLL